MPKTEFMAGYLQFFWAGVVKHLQTGSVIPCQRFLVQRMIAPIPADYTGRVVELGSGTGGLTMRLAARCPKATILACEINPVLAEITRRNLLKAGVNGRVQVRAQSAQQLLPELMVSSAKKPGYIVSGLPIGNLRKRKVLELLHAVTHVLPENGMFIQVQHLLWDRKHLRRVFGRVRTVPVLLNAPPAFVYYARNSKFSDASACSKQSD